MMSKKVEEVTTYVFDNNGYKFYSETDTEVAVKLVDYYYKKYKNQLRKI